MRGRDHGAIILAEVEKLQLHLYGILLGQPAALNVDGLILAFTDLPCTPP